MRRIRTLCVPRLLDVYFYCPILRELDSAFYCDVPRLKVGRVSLCPLNKKTSSHATNPSDA